MWRFWVCFGFVSVFVFSLKQFCFHLATQYMEKRIIRVCLNFLANPGYYHWISVSFKANFDYEWNKIFLIKRL